MAGLCISLVLIYILCSNGIGHSQASVVRSLKLKDRLSFIADDQEFKVEKLDQQAQLLKIVSTPEDDVMIASAHGASTRDNNMSRLQLPSGELIGGCANKTCNFCAFKYFKYNTFTPVCLKVTVVGRICVKVYKINLKERSACVGVEFKAPVIKTAITFQIACFKIANKMEPGLTLDQLLLAWQMRQRVPVTRT